MKKFKGAIPPISAFTEICPYVCSFGNTKGSRESFKDALDHISNALAVASFIPGADTITNLISIPVDLARGDFVSAGLDAVGVIPIIGEIADIAKTVDKVSDVVKAVDKIADALKITKKASRITSVSDNAKSVAKKYNLGKGVQTTFADNSSVVYRVITKTPNSPVVEITFKTPGKIKP